MLSALNIYINQKLQFLIYNMNIIGNFFNFYMTQTNMILFKIANVVGNMTPYLPYIYNILLFIFVFALVLILLMIGFKIISIISSFIV